MPTEKPQPQISQQRLSDYFTHNEQRFYEEFCSFLRFASISSEPSYQKDVLACAEWTMLQLQQAGFKTELWTTSTHPIVFGSYHANPSAPTILIYNHYDVQPIDPLEEWKSPPFSPQRDKEEIFARGAQDNKGQCFYTLLALRAILEETGSLPINIKWCIEGEEEYGSQGLHGILETKKEHLAADYLLVMDLGMPKAGHPAVTLGVRGLITMDIEVEGTKTDLHSGMHGGIAFNPLHALVQVLASVRDAQGHITIPGFYDDVLPITQQEKQMLSLDFDAAEYTHVFGTEATGGEKAFSPLERAWTRPTFEINGIAGGYSGEGFKTVIPAKVKAKASCRLVPQQDPHKIGELVKKYLEDQAPPGTLFKVRIHEGVGKAVRASLDSPLVRSLASSCEEVFNTSCQWIFEGGSIPIIAQMSQTIGCQVVLFGLGLPSDQIHAPNEHFGWDRIKQGFLIFALTVQKLTLG